MNTITTLRALTVRQPWATCIASGRKTVENRTWNTTYRGPLAIHAGARGDAHARDDRAMAVRIDAAVNAVPEHFYCGGAVLAVARLADCHPYRPGCCGSLWAEQWPDVWHWVFADIRRLAVPVGATGRLGLWIPDSDLAAQIAALDGARESADSPSRTRSD